MIEFECKHCQEIIRLSDNKAGSSGKCPHCRKPVTVPTEVGLSLHDDAFVEAIEQPGIIKPGLNSPISELGTKALNLTGNLTSWAFGLIFLVFFLSTVWSHPLPALIALAGAALLIPPIYGRLQEAFRIDLGVKQRVIGGAVIFFVYMMMHNMAINDESKQQIQDKIAAAEKERKAQRTAAAEHFKANKSAILTQATELLNKGNVAETVNLVNKYRGIGDPDIEAVIVKADQKNKAIVDEAKKAKLLETLSTLKQESIPERARVYEQLAAISPENSEYRKKHTDLKAQIEQAATKQKSDEEAAKAKANRQALGLAWRYTNTQDEMTQKPISMALVDSTTLSFGFPYAGIQRATLQLRKHPRWGSDVILQIERGQFLCNSYDGCSVTVRFGNGKPQRFSATEPGDNDSTFLFIRNYSSFVSQLRKVDEVVIEASFYQSGNRPMSFSTEGLDWK